MKSALGLILPGLGQAVDGRLQRASYFGIYALSGAAIASESHARARRVAEDRPFRENHYRDLDNLAQLGSSFWIHSGFLSSYDTFRNRISTYQQGGQYLFVPRDYDLNEHLLSPFRFEYLKRPTTWIVLLAGCAVSMRELDRNPKPKEYDIRLNDVGIASWVSYNAGTGEEAFFRGQLQPILREKSGRPWMAILGQGALFGAVHDNWKFSSLAGLYFGWLVERNAYDLGEATFLHAWWDFLVINARFIRTRSFSEDAVVYLPPLQFTF